VAKDGDDDDDEDEEEEEDHGLGEDDGKTGGAFADWQQASRGAGKRR
jgi:hypothetical protein